MATVPTLVVGGTDQTDYIQNKTLGFRLKYLDFTLVDPVTTPVLHNTVSLDEPEWHGRVSTIESIPYKAANGDDHVWVKVTATNKHVAPDDTAPFNLSDTPNYTTTFPYKDLVVIRTLEDQTDLSTSELRMTGICYEPGLIPGMTIEVTNTATDLAAEPVTIVEMSVNWLRDDSPEFHFELSDTAEPLPTLGDLIDSQGCDCDVFVPCTTDFTVQSFANAPSVAAVIPGHGCGQNVESTDYMILYEGATYRLDYLVFHAATSVGLFATLADRGSGPMGSSVGLIPGAGNAPLVYMGDKHRDCQLDPTPDDIPAASTEWTVSGFGVPGYVEATAYLTEGACTSGLCDSYASSIDVQATWLSGPDPRFEALDPCSDHVPHSGQRLPTEQFTGDGSNDTTTLAYAYQTGTLSVFVEGVNWTPLVTETDPAAGEFSVAYPYPLATDPYPNVYVDYRYP